MTIGRKIEIFFSFLHVSWPLISGPYFKNNFLGDLNIYF